MSDYEKLRTKYETLKKELLRRKEADRVVANNLIAGDRDVWFCGDCAIIFPDLMVKNRCCGDDCVDQYLALCDVCLEKYPIEKNCKGCQQRMCNGCYSSQEGFCADCEPE